MAAVLHVDPDDESAAAVADELEAAGLSTVHRASTAAEALAALEEQSVGGVITEYDLPDGTGLELLNRVREAAPDTVCVLYTATGTDDIPTEDAAQVVDCYFKATTPPDRLADLVTATLELRSHTAYPLPENEGDRLAALSSFDLDSDRLQEAVDRVTELAARHFGVDRASVNLIEADTQTFLACHGADWTSTPREASICTYAIVEEEPVTVIEDTTEDPRFAANDGLRELGIRFYAGANVTADGVSGRDALRLRRGADGLRRRGPGVPRAAGGPGRPSPDGPPGPRARRDPGGPVVSQTASLYAVPADLPIEGLQPGTSVLVAGPAMDAGRDLALRLIQPQAEGEGSLVVTTDTGCGRLIEAYEGRHGEWPLGETAFVDCASQDGDDLDIESTVRRLSSPGDLTGIGIAFSALVEEFYGRGLERVRLGLFSLNTLLMYVDVQTVFRFGHTVAGRVASTDGLGVFFIDPSTQDDAVVNTSRSSSTVASTSARARDGPELRVRGTVDGPSEWTGY
ncbi:MAG: response regulator [Halobacteriales archaeon]|nr:response regulator [Halobacteriales archaeon]